MYCVLRDDKLIFKQSDNLKLYSVKLVILDELDEVDLDEAEVEEPKTTVEKKGLADVFARILHKHVPANKVNCINIICCNIICTCIYFLENQCFS